MQSYIDLSLLSLIGITVVVLVLILISFLISSRHINSLEKQIDSLKKALEKTNEQLHLEQEQRADAERREVQYKSRLAFFNERSDGQERSLQQLSDRLQGLNEKLSGFDLKIEQQQRQIVENNAKTQPIFEATRMLRRGATMEEVVKKTGLLRHEIEMLTAVHGLSAQANDQAPEQSAASGPESSAAPEIQPVEQAHRESMPPPLEHELGREQASESTAEPDLEMVIIPGEGEESGESASAAPAGPIQAEVSSASEAADSAGNIAGEISPAESAAEARETDNPEEEASEVVVNLQSKQADLTERDFTELSAPLEQGSFVLEQEAYDLRAKLSQSEAVPAEDERESESEVRAQDLTAQRVTPVTVTPHRASLKARSAYGIPEHRPSLRRQR